MKELGEARRNLEAGAAELNATTANLQQLEGYNAQKD